MLSGRRFPGSNREPVRGKTGMISGRFAVSAIIYGTEVRRRAIPRDSGVGPGLEHRQEGLLRNLDGAHHLHALFAFLLLLQQLALAADVAAVALGGDVLAEGVDRRA